MEQLLQSAVQHHQAGDLVKAELEYRQILSHQPENADALHLLGVLAGQAGHLDAAEQLISRSLAVSPGNSEAIANLGRILLDQGKNGQAIGAYRRATELQPGNATSWYGLGIAFRANGQPDEARHAFERALEIHPGYAQALLEVGNIARKQGDLDEAIACHTRAIQFQPNFADAHHNLANVLVDKQLLDEGIQAYLRAIELRPNSPLFLSSLGDALRQKGVLIDAMKAYDEALRLSPEFIAALTGKGGILTDLNHFDEAMEFHNHALNLKPDDARVHESIGHTLFARRDISSAPESFRTALKLDPRSTTAWNGLGTVLRAIGDFQEASNCFREALKIRPNDTMAYKNLAATSSQPADAEIMRLIDLVTNKDLSSTDQAAAGFALGKLLDDADRYDEAFFHYVHANDLIKKLCASDGDHFDPNALHADIDRMIETFVPEFFQERKSWGDPTEMPVFIVGMPRSGTSLVEQIVASHSLVFGAGELPEINSCLSTLGKDAGRWKSSDISQTASVHKDRLISLAPAATRVVDKMPGNILNLGLIATLFPGARVIFCGRDVRDNCLSCYFQWFVKNHLLFSYDLADCATQYLEQERLTAHWLKSLPLRMMTMQYEELVADLEGQSRRLIDFLGLEWEPACLEFHKTQRAVLTASVWQVRQPIYTGSVGRWKHYQSHLGPLFNALGMADKA